MEEEGGGFRLSKRFSDKGGEVDYKTKAGTAWSHSFLNQKPWHPLSYPNQRRKWIAEQTHAQRELRAEEISREYAQEQEFFRQTALVSKKEKEKMEMMKSVSFMYVRPPGYNPESAKAAEIADEAKNQGQGHGSTTAALASNSGRPEVPPAQEKKKPRAKDVFGRPLPTEEEFEVLKNAPRLETGVVGRAKPFGIEIRNVKCVRCGTFGHQSGDRECPLKDAIMPNEESRIKRDDPLTAILAQTDASEPLKWELKQRPGISPPRGGFELDDPNQQIVAEDIFDEYGGFLTGDIVPDLLASLSSKPKKKKKSSKSKNRKQSSPARTDLHDKEISSSSCDDRGRPLKKKKHKKSRKQSESSEDCDRHRRRSNRQRHPRSSWGKHSESSSGDDDNDRHQKRSDRHGRSRSSSPKPEDKEHRKKNHHHHYHDSEDDDDDRHQKRSNRRRRSRSSSPEPEVKDHRKKNHHHHYHDSKDNDNDGHQKRSNRHRRSRSSSPEPDDKEHRKKNHPSYYHDSKDDDNDRHQKKSNRHGHSRSSSPKPEETEHQKKSHHHHYHDSKGADNDRHHKRSNRHGRSRSNSPKPEDIEHSKTNHHHHYHDSEDDDNDRHQKRSSRHRRSRSSSPEPEDKEHRKNHHHHRHHRSGQRHNHSD